MSLTHERAVQVDVGSEEVLAYVSRPENLPNWTKFFKSVVKGPADTFVAETKVGPAVLKLPVERTQQGAVVELRVNVNDRNEVARIVVASGGSSTSVTFQTGFPPTWNPAQIAHQLKELEIELGRLRYLIECQVEERSQRVVA